MTGSYYGYKQIKKMNRPSFEGERRKKVVILGTGWAALSVTNHLTPGQFDVTVVSPRNYFLFSPLLPSVTVGTVESRSIVEPFRKLMLKHHSCLQMSFLEAECVNVDPERKRILCRDESGVVGELSEVELSYDVLVVAVGATTNTFGTPGVEKNCFFLKEIEDARRIRNVLVDCVETASIPGQSASEVERLLHFVVVGGGPTGVEFAAEVQDFLASDVAKIYPAVGGRAKVTVVQSRDHILNTYDQTLSSYTEETFKKGNINVIANARVTEVTEKELTVVDKATKHARAVPYGVCVWSTGVAPVPLIKKLISQIPQQAKSRSLLTDGYLRVLGAEGVFALGDCSTIQQDLIVKKAEELFIRADVNKDGTLTFDEFLSIMEEAKKMYPQVSMQLSYVENNIERMFEAVDTSGDQKLDFAEFRDMLAKMDRQLKSLPATAQVASQQGEYLSELLSRTNGDVCSQPVTSLEAKGLSPFKYRHLGSFAYVGDNKAVLQLPIIGTLSGRWTMWLWRAAYASECASGRTKLLVLGDWAKSHVFGRDSSRI